jgi:hypothetical protein
LSVINLVEAVSRTFDEAAADQLPKRIGLGPDVTREIIERGAAVIIAALMGHCATSQDCASVFSAVMSADSDPRIGEQLHVLVADSSSLKDLEAAGDALSKRATQRRIGALSDPIASMTGLPMQAVHVLVGLSAIVMFGVLKRHLLVDQASVADFAHLLARQMPSVEPFVTDGIAHALGFADASGFAEAVETRLVAPRKPSAAPIYGHVNVPVSTTIRTALFPVPMLPPRLDEPVREPAPATASAQKTRARAPARRRKSWHWARWVLVMFILLAACASAIFSYHQAHPGFLKSAFVQLGVDRRDDNTAERLWKAGAVTPSSSAQSPSAPEPRRDQAPVAAGGAGATRGESGTSRSPRRRRAGLGARRPLLPARAVALPDARRLQRFHSLRYGPDTCESWAIRRQFDLRFSSRCSQARYRL